MKRTFLAGIHGLVSMCAFVAVAGAQELSVASLPAVVVKTEPQAGLRNVDPNISEIRVTYSKKMLNKSWSWGQISDDTFPQTAGEPHYERDGKTCVLPVKLEPGRTYVLQLNSLKGTFANFKDAQKRPAVPYLLVFETKKRR
jgi:RNA polymerase sigma-70 factor (ECF subfamily)